MMLSNCHPETDLHNQTFGGGGEMGHVGKQLFLRLSDVAFGHRVHMWPVCPSSRRLCHRADDLACC